jgi:hypothetical protein
MPSRVTLATERSCDWTLRAWHVPVVFAVGKIFGFGPLVQLQGAVKGYAATPAGGPGSGFRFNATLLFPKR